MGHSLCVARALTPWLLATWLLAATPALGNVVDKCADGKVCCDDCDQECTAEKAPCFSLCQKDCATRDGRRLPPSRVPEMPPPAECTTGGVCCTNCATTCPGSTIACFSNCTSPCVEAGECVRVGDAVAQGVAAAACERTKAACGMPTVQLSAGVDDRITVEKCCRVAIGSCQGIAEGQDCDVEDGGFGSCIEDDFVDIYKQTVSDLCAEAICVDALCRDEVIGDSRCSPLG